MKHLIKLFLSLFTLYIFPNFVVAQANPNHLPWSASRKLTADDFYIKTKSLETTASFAQFSVDYQLSGFDFMTKNFNKKVQNYLIRSASWIDTTTYMNETIAYQQTLFDICEIYARKFRKALRDNRKQIAKGTQVAQTLNNEIMAEFSKRRIAYDRDTKFGTDPLKQKEWEMQIQKELMEYMDFAFDK